MCFNRKLLIGAAILAIYALNVPNVFAAYLDGSTVPKYVNDLPVIRDLGLRYDLTGGGNIAVEMQQTSQNLLGPAYPNTTVWGYKFPGLPTTYPGATIVAREGVPVQVKWKNKLPKGSHLLPVDRTLHMAEPIALALKKKFIPTVTHLHGGHTESASDGLPEAWFTQSYTLTGRTFVKKTYRYDNDQEAATLWYHDHALGITRLNVYAGLAGFYLLRDDNENAFVNAGVLPGGAQEIEIVIQDRQFTDSGELTLPFTPDEVGAIFEYPPEVIEGLPTPTVAAEFFGDVILVNGKAWPKLSVDQGKYRLRLLNGSDSRFYILKFQNENGNMTYPFLVIGNDNGLLNRAIEISELPIGPGERYDIVVDFPAAGQVFLRNFGPDEPWDGFPVPAGDEADPDTTGQIMRFDVSANMAPAASVVAGTDLRRLIPDLPAPIPTANTRQLALFEGEDEYGRLQPLLGTVNAFPGGGNGSLGWFQKITENIAFNATETWEVYNATADAHPIHLHLVSFRIIDRQLWNILTFSRPQAQHNGEVGVGANIRVGGGPTDRPSGPAAYEAGKKDTAIMRPGERTRVVAKFDREGRYVWHCHILSHEDHEMMRPYCVGDYTEENCGPLGDDIVIPNG